MNASPLPAYMVCPIVRESRLVSDKTPPARDWSRYEEPTYIRAPMYVTHSRTRHKWPVVKVSYLLKRQAS